MKLEAIPHTDESLSLVDDFQCEYPYIRDYLRDPTRALRDGRTGDTKTTLVVDKDTNKVAAYFSIKNSSLRVEEKNDTETEVFIYPTVEIVMLAVDLRFRNMGIGEIVLGYVIDKVINLRSEVGIRAITLFSVPKAVSFYRDKCNFIELSEGMEMYIHPSCEDCKPMFLVLPETE
jgi:hypothetical protein